jgi:hypothetical protein
MSGVVGLALALATEIFKFVNTENSRKYLDRSIKLQKEIQEEEARGYYADDAKIEHHYKELQIIAGAAASELQALQSKKS